MWSGLLYHDFMGMCSARIVAISSAASSELCPLLLLVDVDAMVYMCIDIDSYGYAGFP